MKKTIYIVAMAAVMSGCGWMQNKQHAGVAVELNGKTLTYVQLDEVTASAKDSADSVAMAEAYIRQWAIGILEYEDATKRANDEIDRMVEDYRRSLYVHEYEQRLVSKNHPKAWPDSVVNSFYKAQQSQLRLKESILKGVLLIVPKGAPQIDKAKAWLSNLNESNTEKIEKYAYHYATGYEYFVNEWVTANQILLRLPIQTDILTERLVNHKQIVVEDSSSIYMLQVADKRMANDIMPLDYARKNIEQILQNRWSIDFLQTEREQLLEEAERYNKLKRYEK